MVKDYPNVKNACLEQNIYDYGSRSLSVSETKYPGKRAYNVWFVAYGTFYRGEWFTRNRNDHNVTAKTYFKEFNTFEEAEEAFYKYNPIKVVNQEEKNIYLPAYEYVPMKL